MTPEAYISYKLLSSPAVASIVGDRSYNVFVPKADMEMPFVVFRRGQSNNDSTLSSPGPIGMPMTTIFVSAWAETLGEARRLGDAVREALDGQIGFEAGVSIVSLSLTSEVDDYIDPAPAGAQLPLAYEVRQVYQVRWQRQ
jgi:hypothetical protein